MNLPRSIRIAMPVLALLALLGGAASAPAQTAAPSAASAPASAPAVAAVPLAEWFDFWVGDWALAWRNADGSAGTGRNRITKILDAAVIQEDFETLPGNPAPLLKGRSLSVLSNGVWRQAWADNQGGFFAFSGQLDGDRRIFITPTRERDGEALAQRMVFHSITPRSLTWDWESSADGGRTWALQWRVLYSR